MKTIHALMFLLLVHFVSAQRDSVALHLNQVKFSVSRLAHDIRGIEMSYEKQYKQRYSTQFSGAYIFDPFKNAHLSPWTKLQGFSFGLEQKKFATQVGRTSGYISLAYDLLHCKYEIVDIFGYRFPTDSTEDAHQHWDTVTVKKTTHALTLRLGTQILVKKRLVIEFSFGPGIRYRSVKHQGKLRSEDVLEMPRHPNYWYMQSVEGRSVLPYISFGIKLGYVFKS